MSSLELFKDWSNILLTTTVAALGWVTAKERLRLSPTLMRAATFCLCGSVIFGIFTLALVPSVAEELLRTSAKNPEIYLTAGKLYLLGSLSDPFDIKLVDACWPQHGLFLLGVVFYVIAALRAPIDNGSSG